MEHQVQFYWIRKERLEEEGMEKREEGMRKRKKRWIKGFRIISNYSWV